MIGKPIRNAMLDDPQALADARRAAWAIYNEKPHPGYRRIGNGHFSAVFAIANRPGLVLKVGGLGGYGGSLTRGSAYLYEEQPDAWPRYVQFLVDTYSPEELPEWAPRVYHAERLCGEFYFAIVERLAPGDFGEARAMVPCSLRERLAYAADEYGTWGDMHAGNFMLRGDVAVITDPWYIRA